MNVFFKNVSEKHLQKLFEERNYYRSCMTPADSSGEHKEGYRLMAEFYEALIAAAQKHIEDNS